jgi:hypothetical protein
MDIPLKNSWLFSFIQSIHLVGIALSVGAIALIDFNLLGFGVRGRGLPDIARRIEPWTWLGFAVMLVTGAVLFGSDVSRYVRNPAFIFKLAVLFLAAMFHFIVHRRIEALSPAWAKLVALISIALWTCVVIGGRAIADFDV